MTPPLPNDATFLLVQARRPDDRMLVHERSCFARALGVAEEHVATVNLLEGEVPASSLEAHPLVLVGGSGDFSVTGDEPWLPRMFSFLKNVALEQKKPLFGSCFGFQALVVAAGGEVITDLDRSEVGTFDILVSPEGARDPLFAGAPGRFLAQLGHKDRATRVPSSLVPLAFSEKCPYQAVRVRDSQCVATQFHPELTKEDTTYRYLTYLEAYQLAVPSPGQPDPVLDGFKDSPESTALLRRWAHQALRSLG